MEIIEIKYFSYPLVYTILLEPTALLYVLPVSSGIQLQATL